MALLSSLFYFIIVIGILVFIHEFGHFAAARFTGMRVDVFALGMGARLFGYNKKTGFTFGKLSEDFEFDGTTDYRVSILPIGGYVKIVGMVDESFDTEYAGKDPEPWEFRAKSAPAKAFAISAGVIMNFILAILIFAGITFFEGKTYMATTDIAYVDPTSIYADMGFASGDKILKVDNEEVETWNEFADLLVIDELGAGREITLDRRGETVVIKTDGEKILKSLANKDLMGLYPKHRNVLINSVAEERPAAKAGIEPNDVILSIAGTPIVSSKQVTEIIGSHKNQEISITLKRDTENISLKVTPSDEGVIGIGLSGVYTGPELVKDFSVFESLADGFSATVKTANQFFDTFSAIIDGILSFKQAVGGPVMIAKQAAQQADKGLSSFLSFMAMLSVTLAVINIMPFPGLDGGHLVFIIIEGIIRREVPIKVKLAFTQVGLLILMLFMAFAVYVDFTR